MDIEDLMVKAIQSYDGGNELIMAIADQLAPHIIKELGLKQDWAILTLRRTGRGDTVEDIAYECDSRAAVESAMQWEQYQESRREWMNTQGKRQAIGTRLFTEWAEDAEVPVDEELAALVAEDAV